MSTTFPTLREVSHTTPRAWFDLDGLDGHLRWAAQRSAEADVVLAYSVKTNPSAAILRRVAAAGLAAEAISGAEVDAAVGAGFDLGDIVLGGPAKAWPSGSVPRGLLALVDDTLPGFRAGADPAAGHRYHCVRLRYPGVGSRLGLDTEDESLRAGLARTLRDAHWRGLAVGLATHEHYVPRSGLAAWIGAVLQLMDALAEVDAAAPALISCVDLGGGFDDAALDELLVGPSGHILRNRIRDRLPECRQIVLEPGKSLVERFGAVIASVLAAGPGDDVIVDACMAELPWPRRQRPVYRWLENEWRALGPGAGTIYGRTTAETDVLSTGLDLRGVSASQVLLFGQAGAYDVSMRNVFGRGYVVEDEA